MFQSAVSQWMALILDRLGTIVYGGWSTLVYLDSVHTNAFLYENAYI